MNVTRLLAAVGIVAGLVFQSWFYGPDAKAQTYTHPITPTLTAPQITDRTDTTEGLASGQLVFEAVKHYAANKFEVTGPVDLDALNLVPGTAYFFDNVTPNGVAINYTARELRRHEVGSPPGAVAGSTNFTLLPQSTALITLTDTVVSATVTSLDRHNAMSIISPIALYDFVNSYTGGQVTLPSNAFTNKPLQFHILPNQTLTFAPPNDATLGTFTAGTDSQFVSIYNDGADWVWSDRGEGGDDIDELTTGETIGTSDQRVVIMPSDAPSPPFTPSNAYVYKPKVDNFTVAAIPASYAALDADYDLVGEYSSPFGSTFRQVCGGSANLQTFTTFRENRDALIYEIKFGCQFAFVFPIAEAAIDLGGETSLIDSVVETNPTLTTVRVKGASYVTVSQDAGGATWNLLVQNTQRSPFVPSDGGDMHAVAVNRCVDGRTYQVPKPTGVERFYQLLIPPGLASGCIVDGTTYNNSNPDEDLLVTWRWPGSGLVLVPVGGGAQGGLPQQGELPAAIVTQGIYSANGTNNATTLPAATGSQDRVMIHATTTHGGTVIGVQPGESLLRVGDSSYTTQAPGELLLFIDSEVGNWDMNIVGNAISVSSRVGEMFFAPAGSTRLGVLPVSPGTVTGGALAYPVWAAMYPEFISGDDIVFPPDVAGMFLRNLGGDAANEGLFQADRFRSHQHVGGKPVYGAEAAFGTTTGGGGNGGVSNWDGSSANRPLTSFTGGDETNPVNRSYQLYVIVDNYDVRAMEGLAAAAPIQEGSNANGSWQDVGTWRTQRGTFSGAGVDALVTFPQPFADTSYQCTTAIVNASTSTISASVQSKTTTGFNLRRRFINSGSEGEATEDTDWTCIGLK